MTTPKFILSKSRVLKQYNIIKSLADQVSYSSKTNSEVSPILESETDCFFSIHLTNELKNIKDKSRVWFLAQSWSSKKIQDLLNQKINSFVVDNLPDLNTLIDHLAKNPKKINLLLRLKLKEHTLKTERYFVFGMSSKIINEQIPKLRNNKNIKNLGVHFHRKTQNLSEWDLTYELKNTLTSETLENIDLINIGGGIPAVYANTNKKVLNSIIKKIKEAKSWINKHNIKLLIEPGRFIAAPSVKLQTKIIGMYENTIIVDASVYNSDLDALIVPVKLLVENELKDGTPYTIKGITPCSLDIFRYKVFLKNPKIGDKLTFLNAGAYNFSSDFCDLKKIRTSIIDD